MGYHMKSGVVYLKIGQSVQVVNKRITLEDIAELYALDQEIVKQLGQLVIFTVKGDKNEKHVVSALKLIQVMQKECPGIQIEPIGETDIVVEYRIPGPDRKALDYAKLVVLCIIVFFGSAFTIMTFNTDVSVGDVFDQIYELVMGMEKEGGSVLELSYCIGIPIGVLAFYNHFSASKVKDDPTPIHIEMRSYEEDMNKAIIQDASREGREIK